MLPQDRFAYSPIAARPPLRLPNGARIAVYTIVNVEYWDFEKPVARQYFPAPQNVVTVPDVPNWSWHEYGMRVGIWRLLDAIRQRGLPAATAINARVCDSFYEPIARAMRDADWEFMGHGVVQGALQTLPDPFAAIRESFEILKAYAGRAPLGWLGPGLHETPDTPEHLASAGFKYLVDWALDDQPFWLATKTGPLVSMPYSVELSDLPMMVAHAHESDVWFKRAVAQFDRFYAEGATNPRVMSLSVHPYIIGVAHRIGFFEQVLDHIKSRDDVWFTTPGEIYAWFAAQG